MIGCLLTSTLGKKPTILGILFVFPCCRTIIISHKQTNSKHWRCYKKNQRCGKVDNRLRPESQLRKDRIVCFSQNGHKHKQSYVKARKRHSGIANSDWHPRNHHPQLVDMGSTNTQSDN